MKKIFLITILLLGYMYIATGGLDTDGAGVSVSESGKNQIEAGEENRSWLASSNGRSTEKRRAMPEDSAASEAPAVLEEEASQKEVQDGQLESEVEDSDSVEVQDAREDSSAGEEELAETVLEEAHQAVYELYDMSVVYEDSQGNLSLRPPHMEEKEEVIDYLSDHFDTPILSFMKLFMVRDMPEDTYSLIRYRGMTDILTAKIEETNIASATNSRVIAIVELNDGGEHWGKVQVRYTLGRDREGNWKVTNLRIQ